MKFPILNFMAELILSMPVNSALLSVQFDEAVVA